MGRGRGPVYLSYTALTLLSAPLLASADGSLWKVDIWEGPAPPAASGPPFSAHANRNRADLPYEIIGIVGAYVGTVLIVGSLLLTVGRKCRKQAQSMAQQPKEMVKPLVRVMDPSPISPASQRSWYNLRAKKSTGSVRSGMSPGMDSVASFDRQVVEADRARGQEEMERLYAAVMAQDNQKNTSQQNVADVPPEYSGRGYPPRLITDNPNFRHLQGSGPASPQTPMSPYRAIYPPDSDLPGGPMSPRSPIKAEYQNYSMPRENSADGALRPTRVERTPSSGSGSQPAPQKDSKKLRKSLRSIKISGPIMRDDNSDGLLTPLSPRTYADPGIPPEPPTAGTTRTADSNFHPPTTPGTSRTIPDEYGLNERSQERMDEIRALPAAYPQRGVQPYAYNNQPQAVTDAASTRPDPNKSASSTQNTLPFREMNRQYAADQARQAAAFPLSPGQWNNASNPLASPGTPGLNYITSAGPVKTTFVDARKNHLALGTGGLRTGQATPYSPYMPFTPLTPVTPRLATRQERRQREKEERRARGALTAEDAVVEEDEMWSSGY